MATATKKQQPKGEHQELRNLIDNLRINKKYLAELTGINPYTFKMKLTGKNPNYKFTDAEVTAIKAALCELGGKLQEHCS